MSAPQNGQADGLSPAELDAEDSAPLPDRQAMSTIKIGLGDDIDNFAMPINEATAINQYTVQSYAIADADQIVLLGQDDTTVS
jgi:hypothetical protein